MREIAEHVIKVSEELDEGQLDVMINSIKKADRVFVVGAGRSGLVARAFAMRLVQLGLTSYVVGETITPGMKKKDLLVVVSGSGETLSVADAVKVAKDVGVKVVSITSYPDSRVAGLSDHVVVLEGKTKRDIEKDHLKHQIQGIHSSLTPLGTLFEDTALVFLDGVVARLMSHYGKSETDLSEMHANV